MNIKVKGCEIETSEVGGLEGEYLRKLSDWNKDVAIALAAQDSLTLEDAHWRVINKIRDYYREYQAFPNKKVVRVDILDAQGVSPEAFHVLFPKGIHQACRISGIGLPTGYGIWHDSFLGKR